MFKSKQRDIVITQFEHGRFAGILAANWGNEQFARPAIDFESFVKGVTFHDRGYGLIDNAPIDGVPLVEWLAIQKRGIDARYDDGVADIVALLHIRRLLNLDPTPERQALMALADERVEARLADVPNTRAQFTAADRITRFCDDLAFHFSFENIRGVTHEMQPQPEAETVTLTSHIESDGVIRVNPWPFSVARFGGFLIAYEAAGYPDRLEPLLVNFLVEP
jgi:hypothetical protein